VTIAESTGEVTSESALSLTPETRSPSFHEIPWLWSDAAIGLIPLVLERLSPYLFGPVALKWHPLLLMFWIPLALLPFVWMIAYPLWVGRRRGYTGLRLPDARTVLTEGANALAVLPVTLVVNILILVTFSHFLGQAGEPGETFKPIYRSSSLNAIAMTLLVVTIGPFAEELFFRGLLYNALRRRVPIAVAIVLQAMLFAVLHPVDLVSMTFIATIGIILGLIYEWRKTLVSPIIHHSLFNLLSSIVMIYSASIPADGPILGVGGSLDDHRCQVESITPRSAAEAAGLKIGDIIETFEGHPIADQKQLSQVIQTHKPGDRVKIRINRNGEKHEVEATLKRRGDRGS
jgi:membrane protease YdiL (CAAX protease family)